MSQESHKISPDATPHPTPRRVDPKGLRQTQSLFIELLSYLIQYAFNKGYELTLGEGLRLDHHGHMAGSLHYSALAQDLNLYVDGVWKDRHCNEWDELGAYWKSLHPLCRWGGDFMMKDEHGLLVPASDLNHFSLAWDDKA